MTTGDWVIIGLGGGGCLAFILTVTAIVIDLHRMARKADKEYRDAYTKAMADARERRFRP